MKLAIMQPYFFPYIGYFQLIKSVDTFIIYDDVNYIKGGWINRNRIASKSTGNKPIYFGLTLENQSSFEKIYNIKAKQSHFHDDKLKKKVSNCYKKSPYYEKVYPLFEKVINSESNYITDINYNCIKIVCDFLNIKTKIIKTSRQISNDKLAGQDRVIDICKKLNCTKYINAIGGKELYNTGNFLSNGIELKFIKSKPIEHEWWNLSIIHQMMTFEETQLQEMLNSYELL